MNRKVLTLFLICCLLVTCVPNHDIFAQTPKEFTRLRSTYQGIPPTDISSPTGEKIPEYYIAANDKLEIFVWQNPDLTSEVIVRPDGKLSYPLVGTITAAGLSLDQLQHMLKERLGRYIRFPQVVVNLKESASNKIIVLGQVNYPGIFPFKGNAISAIEAIGMAGDFTTDGRRESVMIISDNFTGKPKVRKVNMLNGIRNGVVGSDFLLKPNDVLYVPRSTIADFNKFLADIQPTINVLSNLFTLGTNGMTTATQAKAFFWHRDVKVVHGD